MPPMRVYIDRDGEPVRQPSEVEAERMGFTQIEVTPTEVAVASLEEQRQFHHSTLDERDHLKELLETLAQNVVDWWPNSNPPSQINSVLRAIRVRYPHMAKPR